MKNYVVMLTETYLFATERAAVDWAAAARAIRANPGVAKAGLTLVSYYVGDPANGDEIASGNLYVAPLPED